MGTNEKHRPAVVAEGSGLSTQPLHAWCSGALFVLIRAHSWLLLRDLRGWAFVSFVFLLRRAPADASCLRAFVVQLPAGFIPAERAPCGCSSRRLRGRP